MDPTANATYELITTLLSELDTLFPAVFPFWHLGGDEVEYLKSAVLPLSFHEREREKSVPI
jgi:N-acetyl-beta-hexosaminidase